MKHGGFQHKRVYRLGGRGEKTTNGLDLACFLARTGGLAMYFSQQETPMYDWSDALLRCLLAVGQQDVRYFSIADAEFHDLQLPWPIDEALVCDLWFRVSTSVSHV